MVAGVDPRKPLALLWLSALKRGRVHVEPGCSRIQFMAAQPKELSFQKGRDGSPNLLACVAGD